MNAYSKIIPAKYAKKTGTLDVNSKNNLVLYLGRDAFEIYPEVWTPDNNIIIIQNGKRIKLTRKKARKYDYLLFNQDGDQYVITIRGGDYNVVYCKPTIKAENFFKKYSSPSHAAHGSHTSHYSSHVSHYSSY